MESLRETWWRLRSWLGREEMECEMDEEMRFHIEQQTEKNVRDGMPPEEARRAALLSFGRSASRRSRATSRGRGG
jgi:hypothetical protein